MYEMYASLMRATAAGQLAPRRTGRTQRAGRLGHRARSAQAGNAAQVRTAMRPACAGLDATAR
jgi:hypothetical protein